MPASPWILEFYKANAGRGAKRVDTRGAIQGQAGGWWWGKGAGRGLEEARNLAPQLLREQEADGAGIGSGVRKIQLMVQGSHALLGPWVPQFPFRVWKRRGQRKGGEVWRVTSAPKRLDRGNRGRDISPWEFGAEGNEHSFCQRRYLWR